jgi:hypothetical protein
MSIRDQEHRAREAMRRAEQKKKNRREDREAFGQANEATLRTEEVKRRIEVGDAQPHPVPSLREDSVPSSPSIPFGHEYYGDRFSEKAPTQATGVCIK